MDKSAAEHAAFIRQLEEEFSGNPLKASVVIQALEESQNDEKSASAEAASCTGNEQYMKITVRLPDNLTELLKSSSEKTQLILVADKSGSMSGNPWKQVQQALLDMVSDSLGDESLQVDLITYDSTAQHVIFKPTNYQEVIGKISAGGSTNFNSAFLKISDVIKANKDRDFDTVVVVFLTDGNDTGNFAGSINKKTEEWKTLLMSLNKEIVLHTVGFSASHDFKFLQTLSQIGNTEGMFRYCESQDGPTALKAKLEELFEFVALGSGQSIDLQLEMNGDNKVVGLGVIEQTTKIQGQITQGWLHSMATANAPLIVLAETWIYIKEPNSLPELKIHLAKTLKKDKQTHTLRMAVTIESIQREMVTTAMDKIEWNMRILSRNTDILTTKFADIVAKKGDMSKLESRLDRLQQRLSKTPIFGEGVTKEMRNLMIEHVKEIQSKIDIMHGMVARYLRGETQSVSMLARAHDLRYEAKFSKNRRQRLMDKRVSKNMSKVKADQDKLKKLTVNQTEIDQLSQEAVEFFFCALSQNSVKDILLNPDEAENAIGFGLAVKRPEHALDEPTATRIHVISGTLVSRTSIFDALEYKISVDGHLSAHGGFNFQDPLGCATVGMGREPINAWLPLYITKSHWERVKVLLKPTLGYFCTLDPLGYDFKQMDVLFMVLGNMIGQLNDANVGEHQLRLVFALQRVCAATVFDFELLTEITTVVKNFMDSPEGRTKDIVPNLCTLIGYLVALPSSVTRPMLGYDKKVTSDKLPTKARTFWLALTTECIRRAGSGMFREASDARLNGVIDHLLHTKAKTKTKSTSRETTVAQLVEECNCLKTQDTNEIKLKVGDFDPAADVTLPSVELKHSTAVDKAMDMWAQAQCGLITNKNRADQVSAAKKIVKSWLKGGRRQAGLETECSQEQADTEGASGSGDQKGEETAAADTKFDLDDVDSSNLEIIAKLMERLTRSSFPNLSAIPGFLGFIHHWLECDRNYIQMDKNGGLAPVGWVTGVKEVVTKVYAKMNEFVHDCEAQAKLDVPSDPDTLVVMATEEDIRAAGGTTGEGDKVKDDPVDDNYESDDYNYSSDDEDSYEKVAKRQQEATRRRVNLPMILTAIDPSMEQINFIRAVLCQAVEFHSNSRARAGAKGGQLRDLCNPDNTAITLCEFHTSLEHHHETVIKSMIDKLLWQRANHCMMHADTVWAFIGYLMNTYKDRDEGFSELVQSILTCDSAASIPHLADKIKVMLNGKWEDCVVLAQGNIWLPEKKVAKQFEELLGTEIWSQFEVDLRSNVAIHVYRESDIPNRHGHCNSNPYIPNVLRAKLGMALLPEPTGAKAKNKRIWSKKIS